MACCEWCPCELGIRDAPVEESGIERAVTETLCNVCGEIWRILHNKEYWQTVQWEYMHERDNWKRELEDRNSQGEP